MNARELMRLHIEALFVHDEHGRLLRGNEPSDAEAPRFFLGQTEDGPIIRFRHDVDDPTRRELTAAANDESTSVARYEEILTRSAPVRQRWLGPAFSFPVELSAPSDAVLVTEDNAHVLERYLRDWKPDTRIGQPMFVLLVDGSAVAVCCTVRRTNEAHEAGVETVPDFRGRGYAALVVAAWARAVRDLGLIPLYSTSWQNGPSQAVARKLGLIQFGGDLHIT